MSDPQRLVETLGSRAGNRSHDCICGQSDGADPSGSTADTQAIAMPVAMVLDQVEALFLAKNLDYGSSNLSQSPFGVMQGLLTRLHDKQARAVNLVKKGEDANFESLEDTFIDMMGYSLAAVIVLRGQWPGVTR